MFPSFSFFHHPSTSTSSLSPVIFWSFSEPRPFCPFAPFCPSTPLCILLSPPFVFNTLGHFSLYTSHQTTRYNLLNTVMRISTDYQDSNSLAEPTLNRKPPPPLVSVSCYWTWKAGLYDTTAIGSDLGGIWSKTIKAHKKMHHFHWPTSQLQVTRRCHLVI